MHARPLTPAARTHARTHMYPRHLRTTHTSPHALTHIRAYIHPRSYKHVYIHAHTHQAAFASGFACFAAGLRLSTASSRRGGTRVLCQGFGAASAPPSRGRRS
eukprot:2769209-Pleurochrysis_carterae.AAC.1